MKKVLAIILTTVMIFAASISTFAAPGAFLNSPSGNLAPRVSYFKFKSEACTAELVITPYADRSTLGDASKALIEQAYATIAGTKDLTTLSDSLKKIAADKKIKGQNLAVSDLFDISVVGCQDHNDHYSCNIVLDADTLGRFVALLHMDADGKWSVVDTAKVTNEDKQLEFTVDSLSPFAIVVDTTSDTPQTGDSGKLYIYAGIMFVSALAIAVVVVKSKKQRG